MSEVERTMEQRDKSLGEASSILKSLTKDVVYFGPKNEEKYRRR